MRPIDYSLLTIVAEPRARKIVSKAFALPSGAIPVLAAIVFNDNKGETTRSKEIYAAELGAQTLIRYYLSILVRERLVERYKVYQTTFLRLTAKGLAVAGRYEREVREGCVAFGKVRPMRMLTAAAPLR